MYHVVEGSCSLAVRAGGSGGAKPSREAGGFRGRRPRNGVSNPEKHISNEKED